MIRKLLLGRSLLNLHNYHLMSTVDVILQILMPD